VETPGSSSGGSGAERRTPPGGVGDHQGTKECEREPTCRTWKRSREWPPQDEKAHDVVADANPDLYGDGEAGTAEGAAVRSAP